MSISSESWNPCLVPDLGGNASICTHKMMLYFSCVALVVLGNDPSLSNLLNVFTMKGSCIFSTSIDHHMVFILQLVNVIYHVY